MNNRLMYGNQPVVAAAGIAAHPRLEVVTRPRVPVPRVHRERKHKRLWRRHAGGQVVIRAGGSPQDNVSFFS